MWEGKDQSKATQEELRIDSRKYQLWYLLGIPLGQCLKLVELCCTKATLYSICREYHTCSSTFEIDFPAVGWVGGRILPIKYFRPSQPKASGRRGLFALCGPPPPPSQEHAGRTWTSGITFAKAVSPKPGRKELRKQNYFYCSFLIIENSQVLGDIFGVREAEQQFFVSPPP